MSGFVYFIAPEALLHRPQFDEGRLVKIGFTSQHPYTRLKALQTGSPLHLKVWAYIRGPKALESAFHRTFGPLSSHGEWFFVTGKLADFMAHLGDEPDVGNLLTEDRIGGAVHDSIFAKHPPHPSIDRKEWLESACPENLAPFFADEWLEAAQ